ncbi:MAG: hypothetical protein HY861_00915 [Chlamydiia bacterium]|nr:hypothetical protein [Chlamydiia bacterium]
MRFSWVPLRLNGYIIGILCGICLVSCGPPSITTQDLPVTKQKQKIALLSKKLSMAKKEQKNLAVQVEQLSNEMHAAQIALIRGQIDAYEESLRNNSSKRSSQNKADLFREERETLYRMMQQGTSSFEAQIVLDRILQLMDCVGNH